VVTATSTSVLLGLTLGSATAIVSALFLFFTRPARRARNLLAIGFGYIVVGGSVIGSLMLLLRSVGHHGAQHFFALLTYTITFVCGVLLTAREEIRWRRSVGSR